MNHWKIGLRHGVYAAMSLVVLGLSACAGNRPLERATYDLRAMSAQEIKAPSVSVRLELKMAPWFDTTDIAYRLKEDPPARVRTYAESRWAARAGLLMSERLQSHLGASAGSVKCVLRVEIAEFSHQFESPQQSRFVLDARWVVGNAKGERLISDAKVFSADAASADAKGGVGAAGNVTNQLGATLLSAVQSLAECR